MKVPLLTEYNENAETASTESTLLNKCAESRYTSVPFIWFVCASTIFPGGIIVCAVLMDTHASSTPFEMSFILGLITAIFGAIYFVQFIALKELLYDAYEENQKKRMYADKMRGDIKRMNRAHTALGETKQRMLQQNKQTKEFVKNIRLMNVDNLDAFNEQKCTAKKVYREWFNQLMKKERLLLYTLFDRFEFEDNTEGMTQVEFDHFIQHLPAGYAERIERLGTFDKLSKGSGIISFDDFQSTLDVFAEMELNDVDIDFEIKKQESGTDETGKKTFIRSIVKKTKAIKHNWLNKTNKEP